MARLAFVFLLVFSQASYADELPSWDKTHQDLYDASLRFKLQRDNCKAERDELQRKLSLRELPGSNVVIEKPRDKPNRWKTAAVFLFGALAGGTAVAIVK